MKSTPIRMKRTAGAARQRAGALGISVVVGLCGCLAAASAQAEDCRRQEAAGWQFSDFSLATWGDTDQPRVMLVDLLERLSLDLRLSRDRDSGMAAPQPDFSASRFGDIFPEAPVVDGVEQTAELIYGSSEEMAASSVSTWTPAMASPALSKWYDASLRKRESAKLLSRVGMMRKLIKDNRVMSMFDWQPVADQFFAYGAFGTAGRLDVYREGFYITQLRTPGNDNVTPMARMVWDLAGHRHYAFHHEFIAVDGDVVYFLEISTHPSLLYYDTRSDVHGRLEGFPDSDKPIPYPPLDTIDGMYESVETMKIPVGLYSSGGSPHALLRQPEESGVTSWKVVKLRPDIDNGTVKDLGAVRLPTQRAARHLYVLPGETWLVLELASMPSRVRKHRLLAAVTIPQSWIAESRTSPLTARGRAPVSCLSAAVTVQGIRTPAKGEKSCQTQEPGDANSDQRPVQQYGWSIVHDFYLFALDETKIERVADSVQDRESELHHLLIVNCQRTYDTSCGVGRWEKLFSKAITYEAPRRKYERKNRARI